MESLLQAHELKIQQLADHPSLRVRLVTADELVGIDPAGRSFYNVNTPADLRAARSVHGKILPESS
jgi:molybdopterin-guanine dinucleotide biosynthesis protein A